MLSIAPGEASGPVGSDEEQGQILARMLTEYYHSCCCCCYDEAINIDAMLESSKHFPRTHERERWFWSGFTISQLILSNDPVLSGKAKYYYRVKCLTSIHQLATQHQLVAAHRHSTATTGFRGANCVCWERRIPDAREAIHGDRKRIQQRGYQWSNEKRTTSVCVWRNWNPLLTAHIRYTELSPDTQPS